MTQVAIVEDESITANRLKELIIGYDASVKIAAVLPSVEKFVAWYSRGVKPDLIFMDVQLEDDNAFRIFDQVTVTTPVVFTTAYDEYMLRAFRVSGIDYLLKPLDKDKLMAAMEKFNALRSHFIADQQAAVSALIRQQVDYKDRFLVSIGTRTKSIAAADVAYFFVSDKVTYLTSRNGTTSPLSYSLEWIEDRIDPRLFFRVSRQCIVAYDAIVEGHASGGRIKLDLKPAARFDVFVSGDRVADFRTWFGK